MSDFYGLLNSFLKDEAADRANTKKTENGAVGYATTKHALLDMNFKLASYRHEDDATIAADMITAYREDAEIALKWLFYARDVLQGVGERRVFRVAIHELALHNLFPAHLVKFIPEYGRFDDWFALVDTPLENTMLNLMREQIMLDMDNANHGKSYSLLAKWMPSVNTSSAATRALGHKCAVTLGLSDKQYRKMLSKLRAGLDVVERKMAANDWALINYEHVPSKANIIYRDAFNRHDVMRRTAYLGKVASGEANMNAKALMPPEVIHNYTMGCYHSVKSVDPTLELAWKNLPRDVRIDCSTIVVADGSGSMTSTIGGTKVTALDVANALAIYFAEQLTGPYKNQYITFSSHPQYVDLRHCNSLRDKIAEALRHDEVADTNIEATFDLILETARRNHLTQAQIPAQVLIISDMEFNEAQGHYNWRTDSAIQEQRLFNIIAKKWQAAGYQMPKLVFWNVNSRTNAIPLTQNPSGLVLISGFSIGTFKMVMSGELDPYKALVKTVTTERYAPITLRE